MNNVGLTNLISGLLADVENEADRQFEGFTLNHDRNVHAIKGSVLDEGEELEIEWDCNGIASMGKYLVPVFDLILNQNHESLH